jgi:hypothetical protein
MQMLRRRLEFRYGFIYRKKKGYGINTFFTRIKKKHKIATDSVPGN